eukprot:GFYU01001675.1.p1 GENE.GFYU01001675.1~~GFYU01001675.1.p1  ORF type:complete len:734 (-),score=270.89 GFYU01001675.1:749-2950(-)
MSGKDMLRKQSTSGERELFRTVDQLRLENEIIQQQLEEMKGQLGMTDETLRKNGEMMAYLNVQVKDAETAMRLRNDKVDSLLASGGGNLNFPTAGPTPPKYEHEGERGRSDTLSSRVSVRSVLDKAKNFSFGKYVQTIAVAQLILCFFNSLERNPFFAGVVLLAIYGAHEKDKKAILAYLIFMFLSVINDIVWLGLHHDIGNTAGSSADRDLIIIVMTTTILGLIMKVLVFYPALKFYKELPDVKPSEQGKGGNPTDDTKGPRSRARANRMSCFGLLPANATKKEKYFLALSIAQLITVAFITIEAPDIFVINVVIAFYAVNEKDRGALNLYFPTCAASMIFDIVWLGLHAVAHESTEELKHTVEFVFALRIINLCFKAASLPVAFVLRKELPPVKPEDEDTVVPNSSGAAAGSGSGSRSARLLGRASEVIKYDRSKFTKIMKILGIILLINCYMMELARTDLAAVVLLMAFYAINEKDRRACQLFVVFLGVSLIPDLAYLVANANATETAYKAGTAGTVVFVFVMTIIGILVKLATLFVAHNLSKDLPLKSQNGEDAEEDTPLEQWSKAFAGVLVLQLIIYFLEIERSDPFGIIILLGFYAVHEQDKASLIAYILFMDISLVLDIVYLGLHYKSASDAAKDSSSAELGAVHFTLGMVVLSVIVKFFSHYPGFQLLTLIPDEAPETEGQQQGSLPAYPTSIPSTYQPPNDGGESGLGGSAPRAETNEFGEIKI